MGINLLIERKEISVSLEDVSNDIKSFERQIGFLLARKKYPGSKKFPPLEESFFQEIYPLIKDLFYELHGEGLIGEYIKE